MQKCSDGEEHFSGHFFQSWNNIANTQKIAGWYKVYIWGISKPNKKQKMRVVSISFRAIIYTGKGLSSERQKLWSKDLSLTSSRAQTDQSLRALRTESTLSHPKISDRSSSQICLVGGEKTVTGQSWIEWEEIKMEDTLMHHCQPHPTIRMCSFNNGVQKGQWEWNHTIIH
jgi:hypothetical protein